MEPDKAQPINGVAGEEIESKIVSRRQAVAGLGLFGLFLTAPTLFGSSTAEAKAPGAAAGEAAPQAAEARERIEDESDEPKVADLADADAPATEFSAQRWRWRRGRYWRRRYFVARRRYWRRRYWRRRRYW